MTVRISANKPALQTATAKATPRQSNAELASLLKSNPGLKTHQDLINYFYKLGGNAWEGAARAAQGYGLDLNQLVKNRSASVGQYAAGAPAAPGVQAKPVDAMDPKGTPTAATYAERLGGATPANPAAPANSTATVSSAGATPLTGKVPYISQYSPAGAANGYSNGPANCGPTSMAQIARAFGHGSNLSDAQLISQLGRAGGTSSAGTSVNGIAVMARSMGMNAVTKGPGADVNWIASQLREGKLVVANGDYHAMPPHQNEAKTSGHYVTVAGIDANGNFIVRDPADANVRTITPSQMQHFLNSNPNGGYQTAIG